MFIYTKVINNKLKQLIRVATDAYVESKNNVLVTQYEIDSLVKIVDKVMGNVPEWSELLTEIDKCTTKDIKIILSKELWRQCLSIQNQWVHC